MKKTRKAMLGAVLAAAQALACAQVSIERGQARGGEPYLVGGVGQDEVALMQVARGSFSLSVRTATRSGAFLADAHLRIDAAGGRTVFDQDLTGPWLLIALQPGPYTVEASRAGEVQKRAVSVPASGLRELIFHFALTGEPPDPPRDPVLHPPAAR